MKRSASVFCLAFAFTLVLGVGPAWTFECPSLYAKCQELLKIKKNEEAKKFCEQGIKLHKAGEHDDAVEKLEAGLDLLKKK
ncbi:MAG: hypothetical protein V3R61_00875 [candidate division NC10 bacterium]|jgi:energy-converting hydrogenase Eha subunit F